MPINTPFRNAADALAKALQAIDKELALDSRVSPEDQLKVPVSNFLTTLAEGRTAQTHVSTEHRQTKEDQVQGVRLDMAIKNGRGQLVGHIELKAPGKSANPYHPAGWSKHDKAQWKRLSNHSNLIYTNGWEWTLLRHGSDRPVAHVQLDSSNTEISDDQLEQLSSLIDLFLSWKPTSPSSPRGLADQLAPLAAFLRDSVAEVITDNRQDALDSLYAGWKKDFLPGATPKQFADSFAQTFAYALLLARVESTVSPDDFNANAVSPDLRSNGHKLIGSVLEVMAQNRYRELVEGPVSLLEATIGAVNVEKFTASSDPWLYFYEDFLAAYDPKMRADAGVYYTPVEVVNAQVRLLDDILRTRFGRADGLGDAGTNILDPATGTATYALAVANHVLENSPSKQDAARSLAKRLFAFELLVGPYAVAHMRLTQLLESTGVQLGADGVQVFLTNTLNDPGDVSDVGEQISFMEVMDAINEETRRAGLVKKAKTPIRVILGNPPYDRGSKKKALGEGSDTHKNVVLEEVNGKRPLIDDFIEPLKAVGAGGQAKNLYNSYVYFIRWAIWKACEQQKNQTGVVSFITSSSYLRGPGFAGMREYMRRIFDEVWIIDLGGEGRGARREENVFAIQTPVAIFFGIQHENTSNGTPKKHSDRIRQKAQVSYLRVTGTKRDKLEFLNSVDAPEKFEGWITIDSESWGDKFAPSSAASLSDGVSLETIFGWVMSGVQVKRKWPIAATTNALEARWKALHSAQSREQMAELFRETSQKRLDVAGQHVLTLEPLDAMQSSNDFIEPVRYGYRSFDRQYIIPDGRINDRPRQQLWDSSSPRQLFLITLTSTALGDGPAATVSPYVPDMDFFRGSFGARSVHSLYRTEGAQTNLSASLMAALESSYGRKIEPFEVACYVMGQLGTGAYTERFAEELAENPAHVIFTNNVDLFDEVVEFGRTLIFEQTWGERGAKLNQFGQPTGQRFKGSATIAIPTPESEYPEDWSYDSESHQLTVGGGRFDHVSPEVAAFEVSGLNVLKSWLGYRMKTPAGKSSSPLDHIQATTWQHDGELLELLWQLEFFIQAEPRGAELLEKVISGAKISPETIGQPTEAEKKAPAKKKRDTIF